MNDKKKRGHLVTINSDILIPVLTFDIALLEYIYEENDISGLKKIIEQVNILDPSKSLLYNLICTHESHDCDLSRTYAINYAEPEMLQVIVDNITDNMVKSIHNTFVNHMNEISNEFIELLRIKFNKYKIFEKNFSMI